MLIGFFLTMPGVASWNGKWSGEGRLYAKVVNIADKRGAEIVAASPYRHRWSDGWAAQVEARRLDGIEARKVRRQSRGFYGYDWMVENIRCYGATERPEPKKED